MLNPIYSRLAVAGTCVLITFLAYSSQLFLLRDKLTTQEFTVFNILVVCIWITYVRAIYTDPGSPPPAWEPPYYDQPNEYDESVDDHGQIWSTAECKWCKKCEHWKPARAHHCKTCKRCILLMDHHCPWINNCVGYGNWPHFLRFLVYVVAACSYLQYFLLLQCYDLYVASDLPSYLGPSIGKLLHLFGLIVVNSLTVFSLFILLLRTLMNILQGETTIESWELERHSALVRRKAVKRQIYPYDVGLYENVCVVMGGGILFWLWPLGRNRKIGDRVADGGGVRYMVNGFEKPGLSWPPANPEKTGLQERVRREREAGVRPWTTDEVDVGDVAAFRKRQRADLKRRGILDVEQDIEEMNRHSAGSESSTEETDEEDQDEVTRILTNSTEDGATSKWRNSDGDTLGDLGVDSEAEEDEDDIPLAALMRKRKQQQHNTSSIGINVKLD